MKTLATGLALSALAIGGAEAQEQRRSQRVAPAAVYAVSPGLGTYTDEVLFGEVWVRTALSPRDRSLVTVAGLVAMGRSAQVGSHTRRALDNGVKPEEIGELLAHLAFYTGWPNAISGVMEVQKVFEERGIGSIAESTAARIEQDAAAEQSRRARVAASVAPTAPALAELTDRVLFADLWLRPDLAPRDRSLVTMAALIAIGQPEQLPFHATRAMDNGLTQEQASEVATHLAFYAGWPRAMSAVPVLEKVFAARAQPAAAADAEPATITVSRAGANPQPGPAEYFTGEVSVTARYASTPPARVGGATVSFAAGARTAWHTHPLGQTLHILSGRGWVQQEGQDIVEVLPGDTVWIPADVRHWHGASATEPMSHLAIAEAQDGSVVTWMEQVPDDIYRAGPPAPLAD